LKTKLESNEGTVKESYREANLESNKKPIGQEGSVDSANYKTSYYFSASWQKLMFIDTSIFINK